MRVSISGPIGSGKTTLSDRLVAEHGLTRLSFAAPLKRELADLLDLSPQAFIVDKEEWRWALQAWGAMRRQADPEYWIKVMHNEIDLSHLFQQSVVVDDARFPGELKLLRKKDFMLVKLDCPKEDSIDYLIRSKGKSEEEARQALSDITETAIDNWIDWDVIIPAPRSRPIADIYDELLKLLTI